MTRRTAMLAAVLAVAAAGAADAARVVSYAYDGVYVGAALPAPDLSDPACDALPLTQIEIRDGALRAWDGPFQTVKGIVTHDGFFNADYYFRSGRNVVFEGSIDAQGRLMGGVMDGGCVWLADLSKAD